MSHRPVRASILAGILSISFLLLFLAAKAQRGMAQMPGGPPKLAEEQFKNIQVLKGIPADQVIPSMQFIAASLGVECEYCHVQGALDKDDKKPKQFARNMMRMTFAINKDNFEGKREVTCYSCHRGASHPVGTPIITNEEPKPEMAEGHAGEGSKNAAPPADQILDKYLAAIGGADALKSIATISEKGTLTAFGGHFPFELYAKAPDKRVSIMHLTDGDSTTSFDGKTGWLSVAGPHSRVHIMSEAENEAARQDADLQFAARVKQLYAKFSVEPGEKIDGHDTWLVMGQNEGQPPLRLYFDQQSGLLLRRIRFAETPLGRNPTQTDFADYRDLNGVKLPYRWTQARPGNRFTLQVEEAKANVPVDDTKFAAPPMPPPRR